jgi:16S rRNA (cytosine1402-N4)-methyltransferase
MLSEVVQALNLQPDGVYVDATFGRGGHAKAILQALNPNGRLICLDKDPHAIDYAHTHFGADERVQCIKSCFSALPHLAKELGIYGKINGILLDLGVSSPQLDDGSRGFSFMREGPLDMRMDPTSGISAGEWLAMASVNDIAYVLKAYGEEPNAKKIARTIVETRALQPLTTTTALANLIAKIVRPRKLGRHPATTAFQGIRIHINQELAAIDQFLDQAANVLAPNGRVVFISFHSLEDRRVKQFMRKKSKVTLPKGISIPESELVAPLKWVVKRQKPTPVETENNPRARSAVLRVAEKI